MITSDAGIVELKLKTGVKKEGPGRNMLFFTPTASIFSEIKELNTWKPR